MKIAISGTQSSGKTTLINKMKESGLFTHFVFVDEIVRSLIKEGYSFNENGDDKSQIKLMECHLINANKDQNEILDRCSLDGYIYAYWSWLNKKISDDTIKKSRKIFWESIDKYDYIFYVRPEFGLVEDGVRSNNKFYQKQIDNLFDSFIRKKRFKNVYYLNGEVDRRFDEMLRILKWKK